MKETLKRLQTKFTFQINHQKILKTLKISYHGMFLDWNFMGRKKVVLSTANITNNVIYVSLVEGNVDQNIEICLLNEV